LRTALHHSSELSRDDNAQVANWPWLIKIFILTDLLKTLSGPMKPGEHFMLLGASGLPVLDLVLSMDYAFF
jgi:hypothetical protein